MADTPILAFFNNKGGVGKTSLVYHLASMYGDLGERVLAVDLDPQANLSAAFLSDERLEEIWSCGETTTVFQAIQPLLEGTGDLDDAHIETVSGEPLDHVALLVGDLGLSGFEDELSENWPKALDKNPRAFRVLSAFWRMIDSAARRHKADRILVDLGPNLGAINRVALIACDFVVFPLSPDLFSLRGLSNLGPTMRRWRDEWEKRRKQNPATDLAIPAGRMEPLGYILLQHSVRLDRPVKAYERWIKRIPQVYREDVLDKHDGEAPPVERDPNCLALLKHYRSLMPMAQEARKPIFHLKPADGAIGAHFAAVQKAREDFEQLAKKIGQRVMERLGSPTSPAAPPPAPSPP